MQKKVTLLFPGQGSQYVGMGKSSGAHSSRLKQADKELGFKLSNIMLEGPDLELMQTENTQPAIVAHSLDLFDRLKKILDEKNVQIERVLGHSVGEFSALVAASAISFTDAIRLVRLRGKYMQQACPQGVGSMYAILKVAADKVEQACTHASNENEQVMPANFNSPDQIVISGHASACLKAITWLEKNTTTPFRSIELNVSAPFHSSLMKPAADKLMNDLEQTQFSPLSFPYMANVDAKEYDLSTPVNTIRNNLYQQIDSSVLWSQSIQQLADDTLCIEVGPGRVLMGLCRKINRNLKCISLDKEGAFDQLGELFS